MTSDEGSGVAWPPALVEAYTQHRLGLVRLAFLITGQREIAEEVVQEAFVSARSAWKRVREPAPYLRAAVVNGSHSWLRRQRIERKHAVAARDATNAEPEELWDVLARLRPRQRAALVLRYYEGLPDEEVARLLGCRIATVRTTIHRALAALRKEVER